MRTSSLLLASSLASLGACRPTADDVLTADKVEADIKTDALHRNLQSLYDIAKANNNTRAFGLPGFRASVDYILSRAQVPEMNTTLQPFTSYWEHTRNITVRGPSGEDVFVVSPQFNNPTPVPDGITAPLAALSGANATGCSAAEWNGTDVKGRLVLVMYGRCGTATVLKAAGDSGALGVLQYYSSPGTSYISKSIWANERKFVPAGVIPLEVGTAWLKRLAGGEKLSVTLLVDSISGMKETWNVISETKEGDPENVVMLGAHLDSVQRGPGINDDGSGSAGLLEIMDSIRKYKGFKNKVRFAWWGAEEAGEVGSDWYTGHLSEKEADRIRIYFNYDMIGSPTPTYYVGTTPMTKRASDLIGSYLTAHGKSIKLEDFSEPGGSDFDNFVPLGIPVAGAETGAGAQSDPCYHRPCDGMDNISWEAITLISKAAGRATAELALSLDGIPPRNKTSPRTQYVYGPGVKMDTMV